MSVMTTVTNNTPKGKEEKKARKISNAYHFVLGSFTHDSQK